MRYSVASFEFHFAEEWQADVFVQALFDIGFDTIDDNKAYIPTETFDKQHTAFNALLSTTPEVTLVSIEECPDENWNAAWEADHPAQELPMGIKIIPHCAFGAGHHETTSMIINSLLSANLSGKNVLDHGTGTGVLAIFAKHLGANYVLAIDIDDKSVTNAIENAALNKVDIDVRRGERIPLDSTATPLHLILANIHRNVLLANMQDYAKHLVSNGQLWLSGFYESDCRVLIDAAEANDLHLLATQSNGEWRLLQFKK